MAQPQMAMQMAQQPRKQKQKQPKMQQQTVVHHHQQPVMMGGGYHRGGYYGGGGAVVRSACPHIVVDNLRPPSPPCPCVPACLRAAPPSPLGRQNAAGGRAGSRLHDGQDVRLRWRRLCARLAPASVRPCPAPRALPPMPYLVCEGLLRQGAATMVAGAATMVVAGAVTTADLMAATVEASIEEHHDDSSLHDWCSLVAVDSQ
eukprot:COSAG01_NODE_1613_length_9731_cov_11.760590_7_plen_203_part_00